MYFALNQPSLQTMNHPDYLSILGLIASIALPLFNIPLILRMAHRKSSKDISLTWVIGVWVCILLMTPRALVSKDVAFQAYGVMNILFFTLVLIFTLKYRKEKP